MNKVLETVVPARLGTGYRWLLASSWATNLGDGVAVAAGPLLVASLTDNAFLVSLAALLRWAPPLLFGLYAGVLSDRHDRRRIVIVANAVRVLVLVVLVVTMLTDRASVVGVLVVLGVLATAEVFADNTSTTLTPTLVSRDDLGLANVRLQTGFITLNQLAGPPIGAALFAAGSAWPFVTEAVLAAAGALLVSRVVLPVAGQEAAGAPTGVWREMVEGFRWTVRHPAIRTLCLTILIFNVTYGAAWSVLVLYAGQRLGLGAIGFGLIATVSAVGGLLGTALYGWITRRVSLGNVMRVGLVIETLTHLALALTTVWWLASLIFFVFGAHAFVWHTTSLTVRQRAVPLHLQGRVNSINTISVFGGLVVGSAIGGTLAAHYGVTAPFWFAFAGSAIFVVALWRELTRIAHADERSPVVVTPEPASAPS
ncbi:MFS transporter [Micromonospora sp. NBC_01699]|uniref:MFS transporter n=1 Tax=Micromonospora sp. NBC_01699 TaxID=2975984 RepID=UPI002E2D98C4|nr:MFS transporter [Micromonospora sp. NBC_01699]